MTWNMDHWKRSLLEREHAWSYLRVLSQPDVALLQESVPPSDLSRDRYVYREIAHGREWGSSVVALDTGVDVEEVWSVRTRYSKVPLTRNHPGAVTVARVRAPDIDPITFVSVYCVLEDQFYSHTTMLRIIADLIPLFDSADGRRVILGGDFNLSTASSNVVELPRYKAIIEAVKSLGLVDLLETFRRSATSSG